MKVKLFFLTILLAFTLLGCSSVKSYLGNQMMKQSGVLEDANYKSFEQYNVEGKLDSDGYYQYEEETTGASLGTVYITFASNNNLKVQYYADPSHRTAIDISNCYMEPGDCVYAVPSVNDNVSSSMYRFSGFRIYKYDDEGKRMTSSDLKMVESDEGYVMRIPTDFSGSDIAIEPVGECQQRVISLNDYYTDDNGKATILDGTWAVNEKEYTSDSVQINPVASYIISYEYDSEEYFYLSSSPECYYNNNEDGIVIFNQRDADDETVDYSVELRKYISVTLVSGIDRLVSLNDGSYQSIKANYELTIDHLRYGDTVTIKTNKEWPGLETSRKLILINKEPLSTGYYKYTLIVPEKGGEFVFNPSDYTYEHGTISFRCFGQTVTSTQILAKGSKIYYEQKSADNGYWLAGDDHYIVVGDNNETIQRLQDIHFTPMVRVTVSLPQPNFGGSVIYKVNGSRVYGTSCSTYSGATISMTFQPWEGWMTSFSGEVTYTVNDSISQVVKANGININEVYTEDKEHKPELKVKLEKSVGENMEFTLTASGFSMDVSKYGGGWKVTDLFNKNAGTYDIISNSQIIVSDKKIGTEQPVEITMSKRAIQSGKAVQMVITMTDSNDNKSTETRYIDDLSKTLTPIYIYGVGANASSKVWYKAIVITIGVVDIEKFTPVFAGANTKITVRNADTNAILTSGDLIEGSQEVVVTISPMTGYYVTGNKVTNDIYQDTMKYLNYQKNINDIISKHPAQKIYTVSLDKSDSYANYTYKLDGREVSGTTSVREGQKLELIYEITDPSYKLKYADGGFIFGLGATYTKATKNITITSDIDGKKLTKSDFNIETVKGG